MFTGCAPLCVNMAGCCLWLPLSHSFILNLLLLFSWSGGEHHSRKTAIEKYPYLSAVVVFFCFWEVIQALNATRSVSEANRKITYAWVGTCLRWWWHPVFSSLWKNKQKNPPWTFLKVHIKDSMCGKGQKVTGFSLGVRVAKHLLKQATGTEERYSSAPLCSCLHLLISPLFSYNSFPESWRM